MGNCLGFGGGKGAKDPDSDGNNKGGKSSTSTTTGGGSVSPANKALSTWTSEWEENKWLEDTRSIWTRSLKDLPVHMDLPRLAARLLIYSDGKLVSLPEAESSAQSKVELVYSHLRCLAQSMEQPALDAVIEEKFWDYVHKDGSGDASQQVPLARERERLHTHACTERFTLILPTKSLRARAIYSIRRYADIYYHSLTHSLTLSFDGVVVALLGRGHHRQVTHQRHPTSTASKDGVPRLLQYQEQHL